MINYISSLVFAGLLIVGALMGIIIAGHSVPLAVGFAVLWLPLDVIVSSSIQLAAQWEKAIVFRLGKYHGIRGPGLFCIIPLVIAES